MKKEKTPRGFDIYNFKDVNDRPCSIQKSSIAMEDRIWMGVDSERMHLNQKIAKKLIKKLQKFVETGEIA